MSLLPSSSFIVGAGGVGKTTLIDEYIRVVRANEKPLLIREVARKHMVDNMITQKDLDNNETSWRLQCTIFHLQIKREKELDDQSFMSDRSGLDPLIYAALLRPNLFPLLMNGKEGHETNDNVLVELLQPLLGDGEDSWRNAATNAMLERYRTSLFVLVHPFSENVEDDGVRKVLSSEDLRQYTNVYRRALQLLRIPFLDLREGELSARVDILRRAMLDGTIPSPLESLKHYANISSKKPDKLEALRHYQDINFPFYLRPSANSSQIRCLSLSGTDLRQSFVQSQPGRTSRFVERYGIRRLFLLEFDRQVPSTTVCNLLEGGLKIQGSIYSFLGCSSQGLKMRKCYLWKGSAEDVEVVRQENGDFSSIATVSKQIARFSLLLSNVVPTSVVPTNIITEPDVENESGGNFTDGSGSLSPDLADSLFQRTRKALKWTDNNATHPPSAFQIRFQGYKGVLSVNSSLAHSTIIVRPSMKKFSTASFSSISVCDYSRPFSFGHLNRQYIVLLSGLGVPDETFETLQREHFARVRNMLYNRDDALMLLEWRNRARELLPDTVEYEPTRSTEQQQSASPPFMHLRSLQQRLIMESLKLRILVPESRNIFGIAEPPRYCPSTGVRLPGILQSGECFVRITFHGRFPKSLRQKVVVSKNPCYLLGDVRVLQAVSEEDRPALRDLSHDLVDVVVFPIEGIRPHSEEIAGSDLDGDQYFVCWDKRVIPPRVVPPYGYPSFKGSEKRPSVASRDPKGAEQSQAAMVRYFSIQNKVSSNTGRVDTLFRAWCDLKGSSSPECERLGQLFSRVVDSAKSGEVISIPNSLAIPRDRRPVPAADSKYVWQRMEFAANAFVAEQQEKQVSSGTIITLRSDGIRIPEQAAQENDDKEILDEVDEVDEDAFLLDLLSRNHLTMSDFTKFRLVMEHFNDDFDSFFHSAFSRLVNFGLFSPAERGFAVERYDVPVPLLFGYDALRFYSRIVGSRSCFFRKFLVDTNLPWCLFWQTDKDKSIVSFPNKLMHALRNNTDVLLLLKLPDSVVIILRFSRSTLTRSEASTLLTDNEVGSENGCKDQPIPGFIAIHSYFISGQFGYLEKYSLEDSSYKIDLSAEGMQLYRGEHGQTFINLKTALSSFGRSTKRKSQEFYKRKSATTDDSTMLLQTSVDLTRFNRRILTGRRPHPLIRKTPVFSMEIFAYDRRTNFSQSPSRRITYLDILSEEGDVEPLSFDGDVSLEDSEKTDDLLPTVDDLVETLVSQLTGDHRLDPLEWITRLSTVLRDAQLRFGLFDRIPQALLDTLRPLVETMMSDIIPFLQDRLTPLVEAVALIAELGITDSSICTTAPLRAETSVDTQEMPLWALLQIVRRWDLWLAMKSSRRREEVLAYLTAAVGDEALFLDPLQSYVFRNVCEQASVLLSELCDGDLDTRSSSTVARIGSLRVDPSQPFWIEERDDHEEEEERRRGKKKLPLVTFYRVQAIPIGIRWETGEFVLISLQSASRNDSSTKGRKESRATLSDRNKNWANRPYETEFPPLGKDFESAAEARSDLDDLAPKQAGSCLARVVRLCEAPFSMTVKLVAHSFGHEATPELLLQCLEEGKHLYWKASAIQANVITHVRVLNAIEAFLPSAKTSRKLSIAPEIRPFLFPLFDSRQEMPFALTESPPSLNELGNLNQKQAEAVQSSFRHRVSLVHGRKYGFFGWREAVRIVAQSLIFHICMHVIVNQLQELARPLPRSKS